jgi:solute carrier family 25 phosphate transporter 23/24/25/41
MLAFYKGWLPSVIGVVPYVGLNFAVYESLKVGLQKQYGEWKKRAAGTACPSR